MDQQEKLNTSGAQLPQSPSQQSKDESESARQSGTGPVHPPDEATRLWQNYQGKQGLIVQEKERSSALIYGALGALVLAIIGIGLWIVVFK